MARVRCLIAIATSVVLTSTAFAAAAGDTEYPTTFTKFKYKVENGAATFKGQIDSPKSGCVPDRKVKLYRKHGGETSKLGGDHTNNKGKFEIDLGDRQAQDGKYYATVKETKLSSTKTCLDRTSGSVKVSSG